MSILTQASVYWPPSTVKHSRQCKLTGESNLLVDNLVVGVQVLQCHLLEAITPSCDTHVLGLLSAKQVCGLQAKTPVLNQTNGALAIVTAALHTGLLCGHLQLQPHGHACIARVGQYQFPLFTAKETSACNVAIADAVGDALRSPLASCVV